MLSYPERAIDAWAAVLRRTIFAWHRSEGIGTGTRICERLDRKFTGIAA